MKPALYDRNITFCLCSPAREPTPAAPTPPSTPGLEDTFDLYVDKVENIPDNASIVKVGIILVHSLQK